MASTIVDWAQQSLPLVLATAFGGFAQRLWDRFFKHRDELAADNRRTQDRTRAAYQAGLDAVLRVEEALQAVRRVYNPKDVEESRPNFEGFLKAAVEARTALDRARFHVSSEFAEKANGCLERHFYVCLAMSAGRAWDEATRPVEGKKGPERLEWEMCQSIPRRHLKHIAPGMVGAPMPPEWVTRKPLVLPVFDKGEVECAQLQVAEAK